jgi:PKD repeat protein
VFSCSKDEVPEELSLIKAQASTGLKAYATASETEGPAPLKVNFSGNSSKHKSEIASWRWTFGDGNRSGWKNPIHTFTKAGTYKVVLTIKDKSGASASSSLTVVVGGGGTGSTSNVRSSENYPTNAVFASSFGYRSNDATDALEAALRSGNSYVVVDKQSSDWIIRPLTLFDLRDITIIFEKGVTLRAKSGAFGNTNSQLFKLVRARNVTIEGYGATFKMNKNEYTSGEHRHALSINGGRNITVRGLTFRDSGGDGIAITGTGGGGNYSQDITIEDVVSTNNRRLGMGIISAQNVWVRNSEFSRSNGTLPEAGVDLEPNNSSERLVNINFINCKFSDNDNMGFFVSTGKMTSSSTPISVKVSGCEFSYNAKSPNKGRPRASIHLSHGIISNPVKGEVVFERAFFNGSDHRVLFSRKSANAYRAVFRDCTAKGVAKRGESAVISLEMLSTASTLGGFVFDNFTIEYDRDIPFMRIGGPSYKTLKDVRGNFRLKEPNDNPLEYVWGYSASSNNNVSIKYNHIN